MGHLHPRPEDLPDVFPVFPLEGALLLPGGRLPLNIFEPRYLAMTEDAMAAGRLFGMIQPDRLAPPGPNGPALFRVGCLGRLVSFSEADDGRFLITLAGVVRFAVREELALRRGYRRVRADLAPFAADLQADRESETPVPNFDRAGLLASLRGYFTSRGIEANWDAIGGMPDDTLVTTLCMVCPFAAPEKQALLEAPTPAERASALGVLLQIETHAAGVDTTPVRPRAS
jgi:Lon protease-like protein